MTPEKIVEEQVIMALKTVYDPELPVDIYELGLIYFINIKKSLNSESDFFVNVEMTVTSPNCTFDPPWDRSFMSEEAKLDLGFL